jgi:hypothetical protein
MVGQEGLEGQEGQEGRHREVSLQPDYRLGRRLSLIYGVALHRITAFLPQH